MLGSGSVFSVHLIVQYVLYCLHSWRRGHNSTVHTVDSTVLYSVRAAEDAVLQEARDDRPKLLYLFIFNLFICFEFIFLQPAPLPAGSGH